MNNPAQLTSDPAALRENHPRRRAQASAYFQPIHRLQKWIEQHDYSGAEPYDVLNSPFLQGRWARRRWIAPWIIQFGRRFGGSWLRHCLRVGPSLNPKALTLCLLAYCDLHRMGENSTERAMLVKEKLIALRSPQEQLFAWGYDWDFVSLRGSILQKFHPNCIATCFCAMAFLEMAAIFGDAQSERIAHSAVQFLARRLNRSIDTSQHVCFSYTPDDFTCIYNSSALAGSLLARVGADLHSAEYLSLARRSMSYLADQQAPDGSWAYGAGHMQKWIDGFHTGYNLCALLDYRNSTGDVRFDRQIDLGYEFYKNTFFRPDGAPKYFHNSLYPIDIHSCSQAVLTFCAFRDRDTEALQWAQRSADWTLQNMLSSEGTFFYQRHLFRVDHTPYMRWGQAWMFRALAQLQYVMDCVENNVDTLSTMPKIRES